MLSEIDLRDWEHVDIECARDCVGTLENPDNDVQAASAEYLYNLLNQIELFQRKTLKQIPKLFQNYE